MIYLFLMLPDGREIQLDRHEEPPAVGDRVRSVRLADRSVLGPFVVERREWKFTVPDPATYDVPYPPLVYVYLRDAPP